ncbi:diaminobutyrate acetyltransferase [Mycobacterium frederiksbergense]|uniref:L-2,4-diaminobutyric acid acetyltransferase n=1 Tax=Mycolicibacterium frederiksbergense TaxID=117567 RepID=A0A6H0SBP9_9MYCO|nr:diaminobutyrate acetyltransferase [Mycolicibacterium frederiksbergense]MCV7048254.1 diaminobutyrate acetyltransferase [Mycolicibacterium frederiksbergense]QIV84590.1 diaminobutyrate acetyltransferase [Mycolicibacterium frederiksbergense]
MNDIQTVPETIAGTHNWAAALRPPRGSDALAIRELVAETGVLDLNSTYAYLLLSTDFADTSIVADVDGRLQGFITGYQPPSRPDVLFVWQVAVASTAQRGGLAGAMLDALVHRVRSEGGGPITVEATVSPGNARSRAFFGAFARRHGVPLSEHAHFTADQLDPDGAHEDEPLLRIGPIGAPPAG